MRKIVVLTLVLVGLFSANAHALAVTARSVSAGTYEDGEFDAGNSGFAAEYIIDEADGKVILDRIIMNDREGKIEEGAVYEITNAMVSEGLSALMVSRNKKGQKIVTAVREGSMGASEILLIGEDFYQFCRAFNGKFYLEYGEVER
ncbi:MAG: hypothetical protein GF408_05655 [Candidatus Omnitrophica bacterium]|nr:hypothetical protein [Candidatus Omnitrophota bacterium]